MTQDKSTYFKKQAAKFLNQLSQTEPLGTELFNAVARHTISIAFESVLFRKYKGRYEVFLTLRGLDEAYPNMWHCPGSFFRALETESAVVKRLEQKEYGTEITSYTFCYDSFDFEKRGGIYLGRIYLVQLAGEPKPKNEGRWFPVNKLPDNIIEVHRDKIIPLALHFCKNLKKKKIIFM